MSTDRLIPALAGLLCRARSAEDAMVAGLSPAERSAAGTLDRWSAKDLIAHVTSWHANLVEMLEAILRGETPSPRPDVHQVNARTFAENAARPWEQVLVDAGATFDRLSELLPQFSDEAMLEPERYPWRKGQPLAPTVVLRLYWHPMLHLGEFYVQRDDRASAEALRADLLRAADELAWVPPLRGQTLYMVACSSVVLGEQAAALAALRESLALAPSLTQWSQQDPSLASLRRTPEYAAIYNK
jgi:hypothetical protein